MTYKKGKVSFKKFERGNIFRFEKEGDTVEGILEKKGKGNFENGEYTILTEEGSVIVYGTTVLDQIMQKIEVGLTIRIVYTGEFKTNKGRLAKGFDVFIAEEEEKDKPKAKGKEKEAKDEGKDAKPLEEEKITACMKQYGDCDRETAIKLIKGKAPVTGFE